MANSLINRKAVKSYIMERLQAKRPHLGFTQVSKKALDSLDAKIKVLIDRAIHAHPSIGKTFRYFQ